MDNTAKALQLRNSKRLATGLFLFMLLGFTLVSILQKSNPAAWLGFIKSFCEAAMVGALADWFAVTALFHQPLGLPIPHTNLIERRKQAIGDNLGFFVVSNFLTPAVIRPYLNRLQVAVIAGRWLQQPRNEAMLSAEIKKLIRGILHKLDDEAVAVFLAEKAATFARDMPLNVWLANGIQYLLDKEMHEEAITLLAGKIKNYIVENEVLVKEKVKAESYFFIPGFVDKKLAEKITSGLAKYFEEIEQDPKHRLRAEISEQIVAALAQLRSGEKWQPELEQLKANLLSADKMKDYALAAWTSVKKSLVSELSTDGSMLNKYLQKNLANLAGQLVDDEKRQLKIDGWVRFNAYRYLLKNVNAVGSLISTTVGNWQGRELSNKLELEVGKDLQFIRINGTIVGGLVGLLLHTISVLIYQG